jgi:predicted AlkP superfamily phosphohydrolase/phosphomutase
MSQILVLGIGGLDADLLRVYGPSLPNLRRLMLESPFLDLRSTIPPEPVPAWSSVYTGLNPANHGMLTSMDCLERVIPDAQNFQAEPFWEKAARAGKRVCVLNPLLARPDRTIKGLVVVTARHETHSSNDAFPPLLDEPLIPTASQLLSFCTGLRERTEQQVAAALERFTRESWDLFFVQLDALDHIQHFLWRYSDPSDPMYPGKNEHANSILNFYRLFDQIVGRFRAVLPQECVLTVVSSHGHERRCTYRLHINEWLREQNFLIPESQPTGQQDTRMQGWTAYLGNLCSSLLPWSSGKAKINHSVDQQKSAARLVELSHSSSSCGGISINRAMLEREGRNYELVREAILTGLEQLNIKDTPVVNWARTREQCYQGKHLDLYPDIIFELRSDFGVGRSLFGPLAVADSTHRLVSGTHSPQGVFLIENWPEDLEAYEDFLNPSVMDVAPTILRLLELPDSPLDGQALVHPRPVRQLI